MPSISSTVGAAWRSRKAFVNNAYYSDQMDHPNYDSYWDVRDISRHLHSIHAAVLTVGGWFDAEDLNGPHKTFRAIAAREPWRPRTRSSSDPGCMAAGPDSDGAQRWVMWNLGRRPAEYFRDKMQFPFFEHYLKDAPDPNLADRYDVRDRQRMCGRATLPGRRRALRRRCCILGRAERFRFNGAGAAGGPGKGYDEYVSDPAHPVPEISYSAEGGPTRDYMDADQRFAATRADVLVYQTEPLARRRYVCWDRCGRSCGFRRVRDRLGFRGEADRRVSTGFPLRGSC